MARTISSRVLTISDAGGSTTSLGSLCKHLSTPFWCLTISPMGLCCNFSLGRGSSRESQRVPLHLPDGDHSEPIRLLHADVAFGTQADEISPAQRAAPCALRALPQAGPQAHPLAPWTHETCKGVAHVQLHILWSLAAASLHRCATSTSVLGRASACLAGLAIAPFWGDVLVTLDLCLLKSWTSPLPTCFSVPGWEHPVALAVGEHRESSCTLD